jgi:hypothetical protein
MEITLNIPERLVKKIKALSALEGGMPEGFEKMIVSELETTVSNKIMSLVAGTRSWSETVSVPSVMTTADFRGVPKPEISATRGGEMHLGSDYTPEDVAAGLGDEDDDIGQKVDDYDGLVPETGGLTDEELDNDMIIEDPDTEAISSEYNGIDDDGSVSAEALFSSNLDLPPPPPTARDPRIDRKEKHRRALARTRRAKVSNIIGEPR